MRRRFRKGRVLLRRHGPASPSWRRRAATLGGAILLGIVAVAFARSADAASAVFERLAAAHWWAPLILTPAIFLLLAWATGMVAPAARGSGIPQILVAKRDPARATDHLVSARTAAFKFVATAIALLGGASVGREGPTVQIGASVMAYAHRLARVPVTASVLVAGGAAGVAAAFNTPLAGVAFAIEELAAAYEQKMTLLVMAAVLIAGMTAQGLSGDYVYFGIVGQTLPLYRVALLAPLAGIAGGVAGALFARSMLAAGRFAGALPRARRPGFAFGCGLLIAIIGVAGHGLTWGTGYAPARAMIEGTAAPLWFGPAKLVTTLATAAAGLPGGIFAPSLATGAGLGNLLRLAAPADPAGAVVLLGMVAYFTAVVRAPLTSVIILSETTGSRGLLLPLLATALIADAVAQAVHRERLYHGLAKAFEPKRAPVTAPAMSA